MGRRQRTPRTTRAGRLVRRWRLDRNPLRRAADRVETIVLALLVVAFLAGAPFAAAFSSAWARASAQRAELASQASEYQVTAVVLTPPATPKAGAGQHVPQAQARWTAPDGRAVTGEIPVSVSTEVSAKVQIWTTRDGRLSSPPMADTQVAANVVFGGVVGVLAAVALLALSVAVARWWLDKRRLAAWGAEWRAGPRWATRR